MSTAGLKVLLLVLVLLGMTITSSGCWDRTEINDIAIVVSSAFDLEPDGRIRITCQMALPGQMGGSNGGGGGTSGPRSFYVDTEVGRTVREANSKQQARLSRQLFFGHRRVLVIGEELAKQGMRDVFDVIARVPENRLTSNIVIAKGKGYDLLTAQPNFERFSAETMREILQSDVLIQVNLKDVAQELSQKGTDPLLPFMAPVETVKGNEHNKEIEFKGYAQFHDDKLVGVITKDAAKGVHWVRQKFQPYVTTLDTKPFGKLSINLYKGKSKIKPSFEQDHLHFDIEVQALCTILEVFGEHDFGRTENVQQLEGEIDNNIRDGILAAIQTMKERQSDSGALGLVIARRYPRLWKEKYSKNWYAELEKATFSISINSEVSRVGLVSENLAKKEEEETH
ncbi:Ger(x)C family spore germination protein [Tumebacillus permanentifrigoris]|uniref:Spore germination protein KC/spore germination protein n=1 Tax=Tumebacillus permanentifrigoris TaxID=378543 RepID=A0A316DFK9_9BACL|nr:Ger(x)C family spore germination protein [Tumebacillus permanentifrigoris]PWK16388.1 spore germination protein KC/spore germination protein [Tumebacillus permanentifrigoris]